MDKKNKSFSVKSRVISFRYAFRGIAHLFREEHNSWIHITATILVVAAGIWLKISLPEWLLIVFAVGVVFIAEIFNSAIENLGDAISKERNEKIGKAKDLAAAGVLVASIAAAIIGLLIFLPHLIDKFNL